MTSIAWVGRRLPSGSELRMATISSAMPCGISILSCCSVTSSCAPSTPGSGGRSPRDRPSCRHPQRADDLGQRRGPGRQRVGLLLLQFVLQVVLADAGHRVIQNCSATMWLGTPSPCISVAAVRRDRAARQSVTPDASSSAIFSFENPTDLADAAREYEVACSTLSDQ